MTGRAMRERMSVNWKEAQQKAARTARWADDVSGDAINLSVLQLLKEPAQNIHGMIIASCCGFPGNMCPELPY